MLSSGPLERGYFERVPRGLPWTKIDAESRNVATARPEYAAPSLLIVHPNDQGVIGMRAERPRAIDENGAFR